MSKTKIWLITAALLVLAGALLFVGAMAASGWDVSKLSTSKYETNQYEFGEEFENINIEADTADIVFLPSENGKTLVVCYEPANLNHQAQVKENELCIKVRDTRKWYEHIGFSFVTPKITVYLPLSQYGAFTAETSTGDIEIPHNFSFSDINITQSTGDLICAASVSGDVCAVKSTGDVRLKNVNANSVNISLSTGEIILDTVECKEDIQISVSTGEVYLADVKCKNLISSGSTGSMNLLSVTASGRFDLERDTGDITFEKCDASEIYIQTSTGDVEGTLLTEKIFFIETSVGNTDVPETVNGGKCKITTSTGDIEIRIEK